jgi:multisubunit Na+/H+ antiporter MnhG subunit
MTATGAGLFVIALLLALILPLALYVLVRAEHDEREEMDRESAERVARRDTHDGER